MNTTEFIIGKQHIDQRGILTHFNNFNLDPIKRVYTIQHPDVSIVRAWMAHKIESKYFFVLEGCFELVIVKPDNWQKPSAYLPYSKFVLQDNKNEILHVSGGNAFGFKAVEPNSKMMIFSNLTAEDSSNDDYRFDKDLWYKW